MSTGHTILLVEDDGDIATTLAELFAVKGWTTVVAATLEEFRARLRAGGYCLAIHDLEIPTSAKAIKAHVDAGLVGIEENRATFPRANESGMHYLPLLCMSAFAKDHRSSRRARRAGVDDAVVKPLNDNEESILETMTRLFRESGREDHAACAEMTAHARREATLPPPPSPLAVTVPPPRGPDDPSPHGAVNRLRLTGAVAAGRKNRTALVVNGHATTMTNFAFLVLLRLVDARLRGRASVSKTELGARDGDNFRGASVMQQELDAYLAPATKLYATVRGQGYALADGIEIEAIDFASLASHDERAIAKISEGLAKLRPDLSPR